MTLIIQPYSFWKGHYFEYLRNIDSKNNYKIYCDEKNKNIKNSIFIKCFKINYSKNILLFFFARLLNFLKTIFYITFNVKKEIKLKHDTVHFLEFEPISILIFILINLFNLPQILITIHSVKPSIYKSFFKNILVYVQRFIFFITIILLNFFKVKLIVHSKIHKENLSTFFKKKIYVINYPCKKVNIKIKKKKKITKILFFGLVRDDKGILNFLNEVNLKKFKLSIIGKMSIRDLNFISGLNNKNIFVKNSYIKENQIKKIFLDHDYLVLPYTKKYAGSAGPMFLALSYGLPIICSKVDIFKSFLKTYKVGKLYDPKTFEKNLLKIDSNEYYSLSKKAHLYSKQNNWKHLSLNYNNIYNNLS